MQKVDFKNELNYLYKPPANDFSTVTVPPLRFLMIDGEGDPGISSDFQIALDALREVSNSLKDESRREIGRDYVVPPYEALWWADDMAGFTDGNRDVWKWTAMIMIPDWVDNLMIKDAIRRAKQENPNPKIVQIRVEILREGTAVQILHVGSFEKEAPILDRLHRKYMPEHGFTFKGKFHEIYLNDPLKTPANRLRTIIRQPVKHIS